MAYKKDKRYIEINDTDNYFQKDIDNALYTKWADYYWEDENYGWHRKDGWCTCDSCRPDWWASWEDEAAFYKQQDREKRFRQLFNENNKIGNYGTQSLFPNPR